MTHLTALKTTAKALAVNPRFACSVEPNYRRHALRVSTRQAGAMQAVYEAMASDGWSVQPTRTGFIVYRQQAA